MVWENLIQTLVMAQSFPLRNMLIRSVSTNSFTHQNSNVGSKKNHLSVMMAEGEKKEVDFIFFAFILTQDGIKG